MGCQWVHLPRDLPQKCATHYYFAVWQGDGTDQVIRELRRCEASIVLLDQVREHADGGP
ncbi:transposase [Streptomyces sp. NPDC030920]|uniref:transposase n=1 Tax=Streptomyces sp. NPDC030920 TaxID=3365308 RepID=UPI00384E23BA